MTQFFVQTDNNCSYASFDEVMHLFEVTWCQLICFQIPFFLNSRRSNAWNTVAQCVNTKWPLPVILGPSRDSRISSYSNSEQISWINDWFTFDIASKICQHGNISNQIQTNTIQMCGLDLTAITSIRFLYV